MTINIKGETFTQGFDPKVLKAVDNNGELIRLNTETFLDGMQRIRESDIKDGIFTQDDMRLMFQIGVKVGAQIMTEELKQ